jgi:hypothetical protein
MSDPRNLVICCDGTTNEVSGDSTNVLRLYRTLVRDQHQICYYDAGVGTVANAGAITIEGKRLSKRFDSATGRTVRENAIDFHTANPLLDLGRGLERGRHPLLGISALDRGQHSATASEICARHSPIVALSEPKIAHRVDRERDRNERNDR